MYRTVMFYHTAQCQFVDTVRVSRQVRLVRLIDIGNCLIIIHLYILCIKHLRQ